ncbi:MAG TPA: thioesterase family protein [Candidatus Binatia bacterium]|nr:thioesterase family protein [Candidatus Binatia bacterium]
MAGGLFEQDGSRFVPTELARGPWTPEALHGGPPAALLAGCAERVPGGESMMISRLTVELLRPVPVFPLSVETRLLRPGRKVQLVGVSIHAGEVEVARATALRIRTLDLPLPPDVVQLAPPPGPERGEPGGSAWRGLIDYPAFHNQGVEHRFVAGSFDRPGPSTDWIRLRVPVVAGEETSPLARVAAVADFGNGVSWVLSRNDGWQFINPDLTIGLHRMPSGEWVCLEADTAVEPTGIGQAHSRLWDECGALGWAIQSLLLDRA